MWVIVLYLQWIDIVQISQGKFSYQSWSSVKERGIPWNTHLKIGCLYQIPHLRTQGTPWKKSYKECKIQSARRTPGEQSRLKKLSKTHMSSQRLKQQRKNIHGSTPGPLFIAFNLAFSWDFWICELVVLWLLCPLLGFFHLLSSLLWLQCDTFLFYLVYFILLFMFSCYLLLACSFLTRERGKEKAGRGEGVEWTQRGKKEGETLIRIYCKKERIYSLFTFFVFPTYLLICGNLIECNQIYFQ